MHQVLEKEAIILLHASDTYQPNFCFQHDSEGETKCIADGMPPFSQSLVRTTVDPHVV